MQELTSCPTGRPLELREQRQAGRKDSDRSALPTSRGPRAAQSPSPPGRARSEPPRSERYHAVAGEGHERHSSALTNPDQDRVAAHAVAVAVTAEAGRQVESSSRVIVGFPGRGRRRTARR